MKITSNIFLIGGSMDSHPSDASVYLIKDSSRSALVDAGTGGSTDVIIENMKECGVDPSSVAYIFITHCHYDHTGGINSLRNATGARVVTHEGDAGFIQSGDMEVTGASWYNGSFGPTPVDIVVTDEKTDFQLDTVTVTMYHTPGHSPGSSVFTVMSDGKLVLFGQDVHGPINETIFRSNREEYVKSLERMMDLNADILCEGHFGVFHGKDKVRDFIESYL